jgi:RimJ/RimL family protein N-acetyltransferase
MKITLRLATMADADDLLRWKNDPDTRKFAIVTHDEISREQHTQWMKAHINDSNTLIHIIQCDGVSCGDIRFEFFKTFAEVAIKLDPAYRGKGIATFVLREATAGVQDVYHQPIMANIVYGNEASKRLFEKCGYKHFLGGEGYFVCCKEYTPTSK